MEACVHLDRTLARIRDLGCRPAVALNPSTPVAMVAEVLHRVDRVLVMTVNPGFGGQEFLRSAVPKVEWLARAAKGLGLPFEVEVDGGVGPDTAPIVAAAGARQVVAGNAVYGKPDRAAAIRAIRKACEGAGRPG